MKIITVKSRTLFLVVVALLLLIFLLPSCTVQKRLYRPGFYVERNRNAAARIVPAIPVTEYVETEVKNNVIDSVCCKTPEQEKKVISKSNTVIETKSNEQYAIHSREEKTVKKFSGIIPGKHTSKPIARSENNKLNKYYSDPDDKLLGFLSVILLLFITMWLYIPSDFVLYTVSLYAWYGVCAIGAILLLIVILEAIIWIFDFSGGGCMF